MVRMMLVLALLLVPVSSAAQITFLNAPFTTTSVEVTLLGASDSGTTFASVENVPFSNSGAMGVVSAEAETLGDRVELRVSGAVSANSNNFDTTFSQSVAINFSFPVPALGDALTVAYFTGEVGGTHPGIFRGGFVSPITSTSLNDIINTWSDVTSFFVDLNQPPSIPKWSSPMTGAAGDVLNFSGTTSLELRIPALYTGPISAIGTVTFRVPPPSIGNGDLNGDSLFDIVDVAIARRTLAGLPVN